MQRNYSPIMSFGIKNLFFSEKEKFDLNVGIIATESSKNLLRSYGMLAKESSSKLLLIAGMEGSEESPVSNQIASYVKNDLKLRFKINVKSSEFFRYTKLDINQKNGEIYHFKINAPGTISFEDFTSCILFEYVERALWEKVNEQFKAKGKISLSVIPSQTEVYDIEISSLQQIGKLPLSEGTYKFRIGEEDFVFKTPEGKTFDTFYFDRTFSLSNEIGILEIDSFEFLKDHLTELPIHVDLLFNTHRIHLNYHLIRKALDKNVFDTLNIHSSSGKFKEVNSEDTRIFTLAEGPEGDLSPKSILLSNGKSLDVGIKTEDDKTIIEQLPIPSLDSLHKKNSSEEDADIMLESNMYIYL